MRQNAGRPAKTGEVRKHARAHTQSQIRSRGRGDEYSDTPSADARSTEISGPAWLARPVPSAPTTAPSEYGRQSDTHGRAVHRGASIILRLYFPTPNKPIHVHTQLSIHRRLVLGTLTIHHYSHSTFTEARARGSCSLSRSLALARLSLLFLWRLALRETKAACANDGPPRPRAHLL